MNRVLIFSAPSGAGKTTLVQALMQRMPTLAFSISATTRPPRTHEVEAKDYYFITVEQFQELIATDSFIEWQEVYTGRFYGTLKKELERLTAAGKHVVFDVDVQGGYNLKQIFAEKALAFFIQPPSLDILRQRLIARASDSAADIEKRLEKAAFEMTFAPRFDLIIVNDNLEKAIETAYQAAIRFLNL
jgi:guanylate kinase